MVPHHNQSKRKARQGMRQIYPLIYTPSYGRNDSTPLHTFTGKANVKQSIANICLKKDGRVGIFHAIIP
jgi:hypothetical protein